MSDRFYREAPRSLDGAAARLMAITPEDMPPDTDDLGALLDLAQERHGFATRAEVWRMVGIEPKDGRAFLTRNAGRVNWPLWFTLRHAAFGKGEGR